MMKNIKKMGIPYLILWTTAVCFAMIFPLPRFYFFFDAGWVLSSMILPISQQSFSLAWMGIIFILPFAIPTLIYSILFFVELLLIYLLTKKFNKYVFWIIATIGGCIVAFAINNTFAKSDIDFAEEWEQILLTTKIHKLQGDWLKIGINKKEFNSHLRFSSMVKQEDLFNTYFGLSKEEPRVISMFEMNDCYTFRQFYHFCFSQDKLFFYQQYKQESVFHVNYEKSLFDISKININSYSQCEKVKNEAPYFLGDFSFDRCYAIVARITSYAPPICEKFSTNRLKDDCNSSLGIEAQDLNVCKKIENEGSRAKCITVIAIKKNNSDICMTMSDTRPIIKNEISPHVSCVNYFVRNNKSVSYCEKYFDPETANGLLDIIQCYNVLSEPPSLEFCKRKWSLNFMLYHDAQFAKSFTADCEANFIINKARTEQNIALCTSPQISNPILSNGYIFKCISSFVTESKDISYCDKYLGKTTDQERMDHRSCYKLLLNDPPSVKYCTAVRDLMNEDYNKEYVQYNPFSYDSCISSIK